VNRQHLQTIIWLRWRMSINQLRRGGIASIVVLAFLGVCAFALAFLMFWAALLIGIFAMPKAPAHVVMYVWDGIVVGFLFLWLIGLVTELQRSEVLSLQKLLHLPISLEGTFLINYLGSLICLSLTILGPAMFALCLGLVFAKGPAMILLFPLLAGFLLMVTALTYQFQGWLAALMMNQRRRRTIVALLTMAVILLVQAPNLINLSFARLRRGQDDESRAHQQAVAQLHAARLAGKLDQHEFNQQITALEAAHEARRVERLHTQRERVEGLIIQVNAVLPIGWLPYGAMQCARGNVFPALLGTFGMGLIGAASLRRSYRTTLRIYTGEFTGSSVPAKPVAVAVPTGPADATMLERRLPGVPEHATVIALATFRSLTRAPEAKLLLLSPVILLIVFGSALWSGSMNPSALARPFMGFGAAAMVMMMLVQLFTNVFGFDRAGFRALVLFGAPRRDVLLGKNLAFAPLVGGMGLFLVLVLQCFVPMRPTHLVATLIGMATLYLIFCLVGNLTSILAPMPVATGSLKPAHPRAMHIVVHLVVFFSLPLIYGVALIPLAIELLLHHFGWFQSLPIYLGFAILELGLIGLFYRMAIEWQGRLLQSREQDILAAVTTKIE
jgi:hypothetical protein